MSENTNISNYMFYMTYLTRKLEGFFNDQAPFIFCKKGCAKCCQNGEYPFSKIEFDYLMVGFLQLPVDIQQKIMEKVKKLKEKKKNYNGKEAFVYECPFLFNDECSVYNFRGIICRSFGLMSINNSGENSKIPFCAYEGLNYSNVLDSKTGIISQKKFDKLGIKEEPNAYNVSYSFLTSSNIEESFHIQFGDKKQLLDWFELK